MVVQYVAMIEFSTRQQNVLVTVKRYGLDIDQVKEHVENGYPGGKVLQLIQLQGEIELF